ncbi:hypothetical protein KC357_g6840 [Hortaea werneckii]|nr:hypothetical protein KC357_g6840 [Hortaea werneckii]
MLPTINSSRSNRPPSNPHHPPQRKPSASEVLSLVAAKYAELFHCLHTCPPPEAPTCTLSTSSPPSCATHSSSTPNIPNAMTHKEDDRDDRINGSLHTSLPATHQTQVPLTSHELAAIHHAAAWSLAQQPHLLLEAQERRRSEQSSGEQVKRQSYPELNDERIGNGDLGEGKGGQERDGGGREFSRLLRQGLGVLDDALLSSPSVSIASTAATPPPSNPAPSCDPYHSATIDAAGLVSGDHKNDDEAGKSDPVANPKGEEAKDAVSTVREEHDQRAYNQAFTAVLERTRIDYLALKALVRMYLCAWQARREEGGRGASGEVTPGEEAEAEEEEEEREEEREERWIRAAEKKAAIELACRRYAQTFEGELRERNRERHSSSLRTGGMDQRSSGLSRLHPQRPLGNPLLQHLQKQRLPLGARQQVSQHRHGEGRGEEVVDGWAERWVRPVVRWREEGRRVLPAGKEDEGEDKVDWKSILAHETEKVKRPTREENQNVQALDHQSHERAASNGCKEEVVEGASRSFDGNGVGHGDVTLIPRGAKRKRHISLHGLNELGSAEFSNRMNVFAATPLPAPLPPSTPWTPSEHETRLRMWSECMDRMNGAEPRPRPYPSEPDSISNNYQTTRPSDLPLPLHLPSNLTQHQVKMWYTRWQELRHPTYRRGEHDEGEFQHLSALLAEARPLIARWRREELGRRRVERWDMPMNAWTLGMEQDTIGFGSSMPHSQPRRRQCEPLFSQQGEGNPITPSLAPLSPACGLGSAPRQYQYQHQYQPSPQQQPHQSFSNSLAMPATQYHEEQQAQRQQELQQHKRIDSHETLASTSYFPANHLPLTPAHQQIRQSSFQPPLCSSLSTPASEASQRWDILPLSTTTMPTNSSDFLGMGWSSEGLVQGELYGNYNENTASATNWDGSQRNVTSFLPSSSSFSAVATTTPTPARTTIDVPGMYSDLPTAGPDDHHHHHHHQVDESSSRADALRRQIRAPSGNDAFDYPLDLAGESGWDDAKYSAAFGQDTWMEDWAEAAAAGNNDDGGIV